MLEHRDRTVMAVAAGKAPPSGWIALLALFALLLVQPAWSQQTCTWNVNGPGQWDNPSNWNDCSGGNGQPAGTPGPADHAVVGNIAPLASIDLGVSARTLDRLTLSAGRIFGSFDLNITTRLVWTGGTLDGGGGAPLLTLGAASISDISGGLHILAKRDLQNLGNITWAGGDIRLAEDAEIDNQGVFVIDVLGGARSPAGLPPTVVSLISDGSPSARFHNSSTPGARLEKNGGGAALFGPHVGFDNGNAVLVNDGRLQVAGLGSDFGAYQVVAGARLEFAVASGNTRDLTGASAVSGGGVLHKFGQGTLSITGGYTLTGATEVVDGLLFFDTPADPLNLPNVYLRAPGILTGLDNFAIDTSLVWNGGEISGAVVGLDLTLGSGATTQVQLDNLRPSVSLNTRNLVNQGNLQVLANTNTLALFALSDASIDNQGTFELNNSGVQNLVIDCLTTNCGSFTNQPGATVRLVDQSGGIAIIGSELTAFDNDGLLELTQGCGAIGAPGTDTGTYRYGGSCTLFLSPRPDFDRTLESTVVLDPQGATSLQVGGLLVVNGASRSFGNLILDPLGTLSGPADFTVTGNMIWRGEVIGTAITQQFTIAPGSVVGTSSNPTDTPVLSFRRLDNNGELNVSEVQLLLFNNAEIRNAGILNLIGTGVSAGSIACGNPPNCAVVTNLSGGALQSLAVPFANPTQIGTDISVVNQGTLQIDNGVLLLESDFTAASGSVLDVGPGAGLRRTVGPLVLAAGILRGSGVVDANLSVDSVDIQPGGASTGNLSVLGNFSATSNTGYEMGIAGTAPPAISAIGVVPERGAGGSHDRLTISGTASLAGTLDVFDLLYSPSPVDVFDLMLYANFNGTIIGGLNPYSGGGFTLQTQATRIRLAQAGAAACTWNPGGAGADDWTNPSKWNNCTGGVGPGPGPVGTPGASDIAIIGSGTVNLDVPVTVSELQFTGGTVQGPSDLAIGNALIWTGGRFQGSTASSVIVGSAATATISGGQHTVDGRTFEVQGIGNWTTGLIELANAATFVISGSGVLNSNPSLNLESIYGSGAGTASVVNGGTIIKSGPNFSAIAGSVQYDGLGSISVTNGTFTIAAPSPGPLFANYSVDAGATLHFVGGNRSFDTIATLGGAGTLVFGDSGPTVSVNDINGCIANDTNVVIRHAQVILDCTAPTLLRTLLMIDDSGILEGTSNIEVTFDLVWGHGTIRGGGASQIKLNAGATGSLPSPLGAGVPRVLDGRQFINHGSLVWFGENPLAINNGAVFGNETDGQFSADGSVGTRNITSDQVLSPQFQNRGIFNVLNDTAVDVDVVFGNTGSVNINAGSLRLRRNSTDTGSYSIGATGLLSFNGAGVTLTSTSSVSGAGGVEVVFGATLSVQGSFAPGSVLAFSGGTIAFDTPGLVSLPQLDIDGGTVTGNNEVRVGSSMLLQGGSIIGTGGTPGPLTLMPGALLTIDSPNNILSGRVLRIAGNASWDGGAILVPQNLAGKIDIPPGGTLAINTVKTTAQYRCQALPCTIEMELGGSLVQGGDGANFALSSPLLMTAGNLAVTGSPLLLTPGLEVVGGVVDVQAFSQLDVPNLVLNGGALIGGGTIVGNVFNNAGNVQPGASPGQLTFDGNYFQGPSGILDIQIGGLNPGVNSDHVLVTGTASLDGTLNATAVGYTLTDPDTLQILSSAGLSGTFAVTNIAHPGYFADYGATAVTLLPAAGPLVVNTIGDAGDGVCDVSECTLREALIAANLLADPDVIGFAIPAPQCVGPAGSCVITPATPLPIISTPIHINGYTQAGASANSQAPGLGLGSNAVLKVGINGSALATPCLTLNLTTGLARIEGLAIHDCPSPLLTGSITGGTAVYQIVGNYIGLRADGSPSPVPGSLRARGGTVAIGDATAAGLNVIGSLYALEIDNPGNALQGASVRGNLIGTAADGITPRPNQSGIVIGATEAIVPLQIGGLTPDERNVISGNVFEGISLICLAGSPQCFDGSRIIGNYIGVAANGAPLGNGRDGVLVDTMAAGRLYIGDSMAGAGNVIAYNGRDGIGLSHGIGGRVTVLLNAIFGNVGEGIDLAGNGRTPNDAGDGDTGPNGLLNFPTFTSYTAPGGNSAVIDVLLDTPDIGGNYPARVDFYLALEDEPGVWLGTTTCAQPNVSCAASFAFPGGITVAPDDVVLGVVTDGFGKSSEASFYASTTTVTAPDGTIGSAYMATVGVAVVEPFTALGTVNVSDGASESCIATLSTVSQGQSTGTCMLNAVAPIGSRTLTATYAPETAPRRPFSNSVGTDTVLIGAAGPLLVNSVADPGTGTCDVAECTLREAIAQANLTAGLDVINFDSVVFGVARTITLTAGELIVTQDLNIAGPGVALLTIAGNNSTRLIDASNIGLSIAGATLSGGNAAGSFNNGFGGAIHQVGGSLALTDVVLSGNACSGAGAGGALVFLNNVVNLTRTTISGNSCATASAISIENSSVTIVDSTLSGNSSVSGSALILRASTADASLNLTNVTVSGNTSVGENSAIQTQPFAGRTASVALTNSTVSGNTTSNAAGNGAIWQRPSAGTHLIVLRNSIIAGNTVGGAAKDIEGPADVGSAFNVIGTGGGLSNGVNGNQVGINNPLLAPLANYGGNTLTRALLPGSPAINAGNNGLATNADQRGVTRPQQGTVDVGAYESRGFVLAVVSGTPQSAPLNSAFAMPLVVGVTANSAGEPVDGGQVLYSAPGAGATATVVNPAIISGGQASMAATANSIAGSYSVTATAAGATGTPSFALTNTILATTTLITNIVPAISVVGEPYTVTVSVSDGVSAVTTGTVEVRQLSDGSMCSIDLASASSCQLVATSALTTAVRASYLGDIAFAPSQSAAASHVVARADTAIAIVSDTPDPSAVGATITVTVELAVVAPGAGAPSGEILVTDGIASCAILLPNLSCQLAAKAVGLATLEARYPGDANFNESFDTELHTFNADGADLAIIKRNGLRLVPGGLPSTYVLLVSNAGPQAVVNARVSDILPTQFSAASWTCSASVGASCPASGVGTVDTLVNMQAGSSVTFALTATAQATPEQVVTNRATVMPPANAPDPLPANNESVDVDPIGVFGEGFETEDE